MYCMYTVLNFGWKPSEFNDLRTKEKAFVIASIDLKIEQDKADARKLKK